MTKRSTLVTVAIVFIIVLSMMIVYVAYPIIKKWYIQPQPTDVPQTPTPLQPRLDQNIYYGDTISIINVGEKESLVETPLPELSGGDDECPCIDDYATSPTGPVCPCPGDSWSNVYLGVEHGTVAPETPSYLWRILPSPTQTPGTPVRKIGDKVSYGDQVILTNLASAINSGMTKYLSFDASAMTVSLKGNVATYQFSIWSVVSSPLVKTPTMTNGDSIILAPLAYSSNSLSYDTVNDVIFISTASPSTTSDYSYWYVKKQFLF